MLSEVFLINSSIFLILEGKIASSKPSINKISPIAVNNSLICEQGYLFCGLIDLPKNLKNSLSGDSTSDVSPPISAFS